MKKVIKLALAGLVLLLLYISAHRLPEAMLLYSGYCFKEQRYLTDQEKKDIVVSKIIREKNKRLSYTVNEFGGKVFPAGYSYQEGWRDHHRGTINTFRYSSLKEFYALNPNGCELVETLVGEERLYATIPTKARVCGRLNTLVRVFYIYDYDREHGNLPLYAERYFGLSNCGDLWTSEEVVKRFYW